MLPGGNIGVFEIEVNDGAPATQFDLFSLPLPPACLIIAVMRHEYVRVPGAEDRLQAGDQVVTLVDDSVSEEMLLLFQSDLS
jgi:trk system potassium uptake protein TrkA